MSLAVANGVLFEPNGGDNNGHGLGVDAISTSTGALLASVPIADAPGAYDGPAIANGSVYVTGGTGNVVALRPTSHDTPWDTTTPTADRA